MSATSPTYPGIYIQELPSDVRTITGVSTSITAFIGRALRGPTDSATIIHSFADYVRIFGGLWKDSKMSYAVYQYFQNQGRDAVIIRVARDARNVRFQTSGGGTNALVLEAVNPGLWAQELMIEVDTTKVDLDDKDDDTLFDLTVKYEKANVNESFLNLSAKQGSTRFITDILERESNLIRVPSGIVVPDARPQSGELVVVSNSGSDGNPPLPSDIIPNLDPSTFDPNSKKGILALDNIDIFNILCIPPFDGDDTPAQVYSAALTYCVDKRAILIVDPPALWNTKHKVDPPIEGFETTLFHKNAALFFPRLKAQDVMNENRLSEFVPCGAVAGVIARTDGERGIWKSPAGIESSLAGISDLVVRLTDLENGDLNPKGINCMRIFEPAGIVVWGARTMRGDDRLADQWKYLSVRRTALYIEESLYRGLSWVVFEPNDSRLWAQIRLNVGAFMHSLFLKGAFQGSDPKKAYLVKCDEETTTQDDINRGIVNIIVGFAPLKPAEFVILQIKQLAGQAAT
jgi:uncharacterized protein